jgi:hypothetical protein
VSEAAAAERENDRLWRENVRLRDLLASRDSRPCTNLGISSDPGCPLPLARRKWKHRLWICECGQAWRSVFWFNYAASGYEWKRWPE